jgi:hypothetical protein
VSQLLLPDHSQVQRPLEHENTSNVLLPLSLAASRAIDIAYDAILRDQRVLAVHKSAPPFLSCRAAVRTLASSPHCAAVRNPSRLATNEPATPPPSAVTATSANPPTLPRAAVHSPFLSRVPSASSSPAHLPSKLLSYPCPHYPLGRSYKSRTYSPALV